MNYVVVKVAIGGFSMGAAIALYSATCFAIGRYGNGIPYPLNLRTVVGLSGWLPGSRYVVKLFVNHDIGLLTQTNIWLCFLIRFLIIISDFVNKSAILHILNSYHLKPATCRSLRNKIEVSHEARRRATSLPILLCHGISKYL